MTIRRTSNRVPADVINFVHDTAFEDLPDDVIAFSQRCLLDLLGVAAAGRTTALSRIICDHAVANFGPGVDVSGRTRSAPVLFDGRVASPAGAALAGGMTIDAIDAHDGNKLTKGHSGCHQLPALLALTAALELDEPRQFLASLVVGYEVATRAGIALHATASDYHTSGAWGAVGAAALGARLLGLDQATTFEAMGIAEYHGPRSQMMRVIDHPTMLKDGSGWGAMAGISAAFLAESGFTGAPAVTVNDPVVDEVWADLGSRWLIHEQYFKPQPVCRWAQPAVEAALQLCRDHDLTGGGVASIRVATFHEAARLATAHPSTTEQAQYSLPFPVAAAVINGRLGPEEITGDGLTDLDVLDLASRVTLSEDPSHNDAFPAHRFARVSITTTDGRVVSSRDTEPRGDPEDHLGDEEIRAKFHQFADPVLGVGLAGELEATVDCLSSASSLQPLLSITSTRVGEPK